MGMSYLLFPDGFCTVPPRFKSKLERTMYVRTIPLTHRITEFYLFINIIPLRDICKHTLCSSLYNHTYFYFYTSIYFLTDSPVLQPSLLVLLSVPLIFTGFLSFHNRFHTLSTHCKFREDNGCAFIIWSFKLPNIKRT